VYGLQWRFLILLLWALVGFVLSFFLSRPPLLFFPSLFSLGAVMGSALVLMCAQRNPRAGGAQDVSRCTPACVYPRAGEGDRGRGCVGDREAVSWAEDE
jgi:hypothetical protein